MEPSSKHKPVDVEEYISNFPDSIQERLIVIRNLIFESLPQVEESIAYGMPAYKFNKKPLIYFAGYKNHIGIYAFPTTHELFKIKLANYKQGRGSVQFPNNYELPLELIKEMILLRIENVI